MKERGQLFWTESYIRPQISQNQSERRELALDLEAVAYGQRRKQDFSSLNELPYGYREKNLAFTIQVIAKVG